MTDREWRREATEAVQRSIRVLAEVERTQAETRAVLARSYALDDR